MRGRGLHAPHRIQRHNFILTHNILEGLSFRRVSRHIHRSFLLEQPLDFVRNIALWRNFQTGLDRQSLFPY